MHWSGTIRTGFAVQLSALPLEEKPRRGSPFAKLLHNDVVLEPTVGQAPVRENPQWVSIPVHCTTSYVG